jgi:branched-chain amino acid transport system permease protein
VEPDLLLLQLFANGLIAASVYFLVAAGFGLFFSTSRFFNFAHAGIFTIGAYLAFFLYSIGTPFTVSCICSIIICLLLAWLIDLVVYFPLKKGGASPTVLMISSLGIYIILQNLISMSFGDDTKTITGGKVQEVILVLESRITHVQGVTIATAGTLLVVLILMLSKTRLGKSIRALASDPDLAEVSGIPRTKTMLYISTISAGLLASGGILVALDVGLTPTMGMRPLMMGMVVVILGGARSVLGYALGALFLGMLLQFGIWKLGSQWQDGIAFAILLGFLVLRPRGFSGKAVS